MYCSVGCVVLQRQCVCVVVLAVLCYRGNVCIVLLAVSCYRGSLQRHVVGAGRTRGRLPLLTEVSRSRLAAITTFSYNYT